ncbi:MAG: dihydrofolate reductase family protein [Kofleriaceae bacterium]|nr:dihydrofolate reductase family protein [Kofleriaceae bacterium]
MREIAILTFQSLDGVMQSPMSPDEDMSNGFTRGGWAAKYYDEVMQQVRAEAMNQPYDFLFGRKTYDIFASHFSDSKEETPGSQKMNQAKKYCVTTSMSSDLSWDNSIRITGDVVDKISRLKEEDGPLLQVHGSAKLIQTLIANNLVDEFRLWTFPVILGNGKRVFGEGSIPNTLSLIKNRSTGNGVMMGIYRLD